MVKGLPDRGKNLPMIAAQARQMVIAVAGPMSLGETVSRAIERAARKLGFTYARTYNIYRQRARVISAEEWIRLNEEAAVMAQREKARREALHENAVLARAAQDRLAAALPRAAAGPHGYSHAEGIEQDVEQGRPRPDLLKRSRYFGG